MGGSSSNVIAANVAATGEDGTIMENEELLQAECNRLKIELQNREDEIADAKFNLRIIIESFNRSEAKLKAEINSLKAAIKLMASN